MKKICNLFFMVLAFTGFLEGQNLPVKLEAESGQLGSDFEVVDENGIRYVRPKTDIIEGSFPGNEAKVITFSVPFSEVGDYHVYARVRVGSETYNDDSFFLGKRFGVLSPTLTDDWHIVNGLVPVGFSNDNDVVTGAGNVGNLTWKWINISQFLNSANPVVYKVNTTEDPLTFCIGARENGLDIDKIAFGKSDNHYTVQNLELIEPGSPELPDEDPFPKEAYQQVKTFVNPVMPGDHPDLTLFRDGNNFYSCGSCFHFNPYLPILHSTDLVHWQEICRVVPSSWNGVASDEPKGGMWGGAITKFGSSYWIYFSNSAGGGQYFSKAGNPAGPWSAPAKVTGSTVTGYDNSVFVDYDGTPYMLMKNKEKINRIQPIDTITGQLTGKLINLDWVNPWVVISATENEYLFGWAEGPVMCKRDGWYYYFIARNVGGGQRVLRSQSLTEDRTKWEVLCNPASWVNMSGILSDIASNGITALNSWKSKLRDFVAPNSDPVSTFRSPNHIAQPFQLDDGTWWTISHSYESQGGNDWSGQGRQGLLHQVTWDEKGIPAGSAPISTPQLKPNLPQWGIPWKTTRSDYFDMDEIELSWHFLNRSAAAKYSLTEKSGWLTLKPGAGKTHILHKEARHHYAMVTKLDFDATANGQEAGIYLTNGNESVTGLVYSGYTNGKIIGFRFNGKQTEVENTIGNVLWLKVERFDHQLKGFFSPNGIVWTQIGGVVSSVDIDKGQPDYNYWVGTSVGLYAAKAKAYFELYAFKDGFSALPAVGYNNYFGLAAKGSGTNRAMANSTDKGGWLLLGGVDLGRDERVPATVEVEAASNAGGKLEIWIDELENGGTKIGAIDITSTGSETTWKKFSANVARLSGQHDIYLRWSGAANAFLVKNIQFFPDESYYSSTEFMKNEDNWKVYPNPFIATFTLESDTGNEHYSIFNTEGIRVESGIIRSIRQTLGENLRPGLYLLEYRNEVVKINKRK